MFSTYRVILCIAICILCLGVCLYSSCTKRDEKRKVQLSVQGQKAMDYLDSMSVYGQSKQAMAQLDSIYGTFKPNTKDLFEKYNKRANYFLPNNTSQILAKRYIDSMFLLIKGKEDTYPLEYAMTLFLKGHLYSNAKNYDKAFKYYYDAKQYRRRTPDSCQLYHFSARLGMIRYYQESYLQAIPYLKQSFIETSPCLEGANAKFIYADRQNLLNAIGICFERLDKPDSALYYYQRSLTAIDELASKFTDKEKFAQMAKGVIYGNIGGTYLNQGKYKSAEEYLKKSITINDRIGFDFLDAQTAKLKLADLYLRVANFPTSRLLLNELHFALVHPKPEMEMKIETRLKLFRLEWKYFDRIHNQPMAYKKIQQYYSLKDSIDYANQDLKGRNMELDFKANDQEYKLAIADKENEIKRSYLIAFALFSALIIVILFAVWKSRQRLDVMNKKITEHNSDMRKVLSALEKSQEENTRMMKILVHDIRSPLAAAIDISTILKDNDLPKKDLKLLDELEVSCQHTLAIIDKMLNVNEIPKSLPKEAVEVHTLLQHCVNLFKFRAKEKGLELKLITVPVTIMAEGEKVWRTFSNLLMNAIKFSPLGAIIEITMHRHDTDVIVAFKDQGIGIPSELKEKIFDSFTSKKRQGTAGEQSFGIGLTISKQLIESHGGKIWFESEAGIGTVFYISLPIN